MVKITVGADCGNSPKKLFLKEFYTSIAQQEIEFITASLVSDIQWELVGTQIIQGKVDFLKRLQQRDRPTELIIQTIVTHGKEAAVNGEWIMENGKKLAFCDIYHFKAATGETIKAITSYLIEIK